MDELIGLLNTDSFQSVGVTQDPFDNYDSFCGSLDRDEEDLELTSEELNSGGSGDYNMDNHTSNDINNPNYSLKYVFDRIKANDGTQSSCSSPQVRMSSASEDTSAETASASEAEPPFFKFDNTNPISADEPHKKRYKSKDSEKNRRNRINEKLQELRNLIPTKSAKNLTKEEILIEAIHYIHNLHSQIDKDKRSRISIGKEREGNPVVLNAKPQKRARLFMFMFFALGIGLLAFPFINPPQSHPLYGVKIPRHHSRIIAGADQCNVTNDVLMPLSPLLKEIIPYEEHCSQERHKHGEGKTCETSDQCDAWQICNDGYCTTEHLHGQRCSTDFGCSHHLRKKPIKDKKHCTSCSVESHDKKHPTRQKNIMCGQFGVCHKESIGEYLSEIYIPDKEASATL